MPQLARQHETTVGDIPRLSTRTTLGCLLCRLSREQPSAIDAIEFSQFYLFSHHHEGKEGGVSIKPAQRRVARARDKGLRQTRVEKGSGSGDIFGGGGSKTASMGSRMADPFTHASATSQPHLVAVRDGLTNSSCGRLAFEAFFPTWNMFGNSKAPLTPFTLASRRPRGPSHLLDEQLRFGRPRPAVDTTINRARAGRWH